MEIKKLIYSFPFVCMLVASNSYAETTTVDLNINKSRGIHNLVRGGKSVTGCDKLCVSYKSRRNTPNCVGSNSLLDCNGSLLGFLSNKSCNNNSGTDDFSKDIYYAEAGLGRAINYARGESQLKRNPKIKFTDDFRSDYIAKGIFLSLGGGYVWKFDSTLVPYASLGLEYSYMPKTRLHGGIFAKAEAPAYVYQYRVGHSNLRLLGKVDFHEWKGFMPYISLGLGGSRNITDNYKDKSQSEPRTVPTTFKSLRSFEFSYSMGAGLDYRCNKNFLLSLGYRYDNFGSVKTGPAAGLYNKGHLSNQLSSSSVGLTGRYLFE
ncbi:MAG: outer membrane beta-barrel protein [Pseudomonadota bacterium]